MSEKRSAPLFELSEPQLLAFLDRMPAYVMFIDRERRHRYVNLEYIRFSGRPPDAVIGRTVAEVLGQESWERLRPMSDRALAGEDVEFSGWMPAEPGGPARYGQIYYLPYRGVAGEVEGYFVLIRDLTEMMFADARNSAIIANSLDAVVAVDERGAVVEFNPAAEAMFGYARAWAIGRPMVELIIPPELRESHIEGMRRYLETGTPKMLGRRVQIEGMRADGALFPIELAISEIHLGGQRQFAANMRDLTAERGAVAEIERQRDALHQTEKMAALGSLLASVAHELNNPLSIVVGYAQMLEQELAGAAAAVRVGRVRVAAERCARIVRSFLSIARQRNATFEPVDVAAVIDSALQLMGYGLRSGGVEVDRDIAADLPTVEGSADQLNQVLANLFSNAQHALDSRAPPRRLGVSARHDADEVEIVVSDNGPGVPTALRERIFDPFFTTKPVGVGTGVGLSISRGIIEAHGGTMTLAPPLGEGAAFVIRLPVSKTAARSGARNAGASVKTNAKRALIVDDESEVAQLLADLLGGMGLTCDLAADGEKAQELARLRDYDVVFCDLRMPVADGRAFLRWLEAERPSLVSRLAFVTGDALGQGLDDLVVRSGRPLLEKPFLVEEVRALLTKLSP